MEETAHCSKCQQTKSLANFYLQKGKPRPWCKECFREWHRTRYTPKNGADDAPRDCGHCGTSFRPKIRSTSTYCSPKCKEAARVLSGKARDQHLRRRYGIGADDYDQMLAKQGGGCAICGKTAEEQRRYSKYLHVDHCHETGRVRGLLCDRCNLKIGQWNHDVALLRRAADYLEAPASD